MHSVSVPRQPIIQEYESHRILDRRIRLQNSRLQMDLIPRGPWDPEGLRYLEDPWDRQDPEFLALPGGLRFPEDPWDQVNPVSPDCPWVPWSHSLLLWPP